MPVTSPLAAAVPLAGKIPSDETRLSGQPADTGLLYWSVICSTTVLVFTPLAMICGGVAVAIVARSGAPAVKVTAVWPDRLSC